MYYYSVLSMLFVYLVWDNFVQPSFLKEATEYQYGDFILLKYPTKSSAGSTAVLPW